MGFLQRLSAAAHTKSSGQSSNSISKNLFFEYIFHKSALKNRKDDNSISDYNKYATEIQTNEQELAFLQPVRFIKKYVNKFVIENAIQSNPNILNILKENRLSTEYNLENVGSITLSHLIPTAKTAQRLYRNMGHKKTEATYLHLTQAALLHDIGKIFIPQEILNKKGKLTLRERSIIELHNKLSYEILKTTDLNPIVAMLALEHHDYEKNVKRNQENQALTISDVYCALREKRPYKKPINDVCAKAILYDMGTKGSFDTRYINYLNT